MHASAYFEGFMMVRAMAMERLRGALLHQQGARFMRGARHVHTKVMSFGDGSNGALGHTDSFTSDVYEPTEIQGLPADVVGVSCGHYHSLAVTRAGEVWAWGRNNEGQLGRGKKSILSEDNIRPQKVKGLEKLKVRKAAGSGVVSMAIAQDGSLWVWGSSKRGQLGLGGGVTSAMVPQKVQALAGKHILQVALGWGHALACTDEGELYSWGYHDHGRLGYLLPQKHVQSSSCDSSEDPGEQMLIEQLQKEDAPILQWEPRKVEFPEQCKILHVACGLDHSLAVSANGALFSFGDNSTDQLGRESGNLVLDRVEGDLANERVVSASAGWGHSLATVIKKESRAIIAGVTYSWGWSSASQLGRSGPTAVPKRVEELKDDVVSVAGGRVHSMALTAEGQVWTWGCGRNGRLGMGCTTDEEVPAPVTCLEEMEVVEAVCGFDHSLILVN